MKNNNFKEGRELLISVTYVKKHEISDVHVINVKMARGIPTKGIDLFVSDDVILDEKFSCGYNDKAYISSSKFQN